MRKMKRVMMIKRMVNNVSDEGRRGVTTKVRVFQRFEHEYGDAVNLMTAFDSGVRSALGLGSASRR